MRSESWRPSNRRSKVGYRYTASGHVLFGLSFLATGFFPAFYSSVSSRDFRKPVNLRNGTRFHSDMAPGQRCAFSPLDHVSTTAHFWRRAPQR
jgi:hypothetical protein